MENIKLRQHIDKLEAELARKRDVFQNGTLDEIIDACKNEAEQEKKKAPKKAQSETKQSLTDMKNLYSNYRKRFGEKPASREVALNMRMILNHPN